MTVKLGKWPVVNEDEIIATRPRFEAWRGLRVDYPTGRARLLQFPLRYPNAVVVTGYESSKPGGESLLREGDLISHVNQRPVKSPQQFYGAVRNLEGPVELTVLGRQQPIVLE